MNDTSEKDLDLSLAGGQRLALAATEALAGVHRARDVLPTALEALLKTGYDGAQAWICDHDRGRLVPGPEAVLEEADALAGLLPVADWRLTSDHLTNLCIQAIQCHQVILGDGLEGLLSPFVSPERAKEIDGLFGVGAVAALPIFYTDKAYAVIALWGRHPAQPQEVNALEAVIRAIEAAVARGILFDEIERERQGRRRLEAGLEALFEHAVHPILVVDPIDGGVVRVNPAACSFLGSDKATLEATSFLDLKMGEGAESAARLIYRALETGSVPALEAAFRRKDGRPVFGYATAHFLEPGVGPLAEGISHGVILVLIRDTTARRAARSAIQQAYDKLNAYVEDLQRTSAELTRQREKAEEANRLKSEFLANMSHELRTPMNAIMGFTSRVLKTGDERLSDREKRNLNIVLKSADHLLRMINDLLDYSRLDADRMEITPDLMTVLDLIEECVEIAEQLLKGKPVKVSVSCSPDLTIESDRGKVRQILLNLLSNAAKFTEEGSIEVIVGEAEGAQETRMLAIEVRDSGLGIKPDHLDLIFDAFRQVDGSYTRKEGGTGLGLAISAKLAELLGGRMTVSSVFGQGSTFTFLCPFEPPRRLVERGQRLGA